MRSKSFADPPHQRHKISVLLSVNKSSDLAARNEPIFVLLMKLGRAVLVISGVTRICCEGGATKLHETFSRM